MFKNLNFTLVFLGALVSNVGALLYSFAVSFYILSLSDNDSMIQGIYLAITGLIFVVVCLFGGVITDKFHKGKIMYLCDYLKGTLILLATLFIYLFQTNNTIKIVILFIVGFLGSVISAIFSPASSAIIPLIVDDKNLQKANSYFSILNSFQSIAGVLLAGILYSFVSIYTLFIIVGLCYITSGISEMFIKYNYQKDNKHLTIKTTFIDIKDGLKYFASDKAILSIVSLIIFINFFFSPIWDNAIPYIVESDFINKEYLFDEFLTPELYSSIFSITFAIGSLISGFIISKKTFNHPIKINKISLTLCAILATLFGLNYYVFMISLNNINLFLIITLILMFLIGINLVFVNVPIQVCLQKRVDKEMLGKTNSVMDLGSQGLIPLSTFLAGIIIKYLNTSILLLFCSVGLLVLAILYDLNKNVNEIEIKRTY